MTTSTTDAAAADMSLTEGHTTRAGGEHPSVFAHHFDNIDQQRSTMRLGMWLFLVTEALFFGGVFCAYAAYRFWYPDAFAAASSKMNIMTALINSILLLTSSLTITLAIHFVAAGQRKALNWMLFFTWFMGVMFLGFKGLEYAIDFEEGLLPGRMFNPEMFAAESVNFAHVQLFLCFYYAMTGIHVIHLIIGVGLVMWIWLEAVRGQLTSDRYVKVEVIALYWHFVDLIWLFLVPLLYLAGPHSISELNPFGGGHG